MPGDPSDQKAFSRAMAMGQAGIEMVVPIVIGVVIDYYCHTGPWGAVIGAVLGFGGGMTHLIYMNLQNDDSDPKPPKPNSGTP